MTLTDKQEEWIKNAPNFDDDMMEQLQDPEFEAGWLELTLQEFLDDGDINTFIRCLTYVVKARGRGEISRLATASSIDRSNLSEILKKNRKRKKHPYNRFPVLFTRLLNSVMSRFAIQIRQNPTQMRLYTLMYAFPKDT